MDVRICVSKYTVIKIALYICVCYEARCIMIAAQLFENVFLYVDKKHNINYNYIIINVL